MAVPYLLFALVLATLSSSIDPVPEPPTTRPSFSTEPFKITQYLRLRRDDGEWESQPLPVEFWFEGNYAVSVPFIRVDSVYRLEPPAIFKDDRYFTLDSAERRAHELRSSPVWQQLLQDKEDGDFYRAVAYPTTEVSEANGVVTVKSGHVTAVITPAVGEIPKGAAQRYAQVYRCSAAEKQMGDTNLPGWFISASIADVLSSRDILPERMVLTTRTPNGTGAAEIQLRIEKLYANEQRRLKRAADRLETAATGPTSRPATRPAVNQS